MSSYERALATDDPPIAYISWFTKLVSLTPNFSSIVFADDTSSKVRTYSKNRKMMLVGIRGVLDTHRVTTSRQ
ncbi:hypothetical protein LTS17_012433 [Exophiala oligosperma]